MPTTRTKAGGARPEPLFKPPPERQPLAARMRPRNLDEFVGQEHLVSLAGGDARAALNVLEAATALAEAEDVRDAKGHVSPRLEDIETAAQQRVLAYDRAGDGHYDTVSAFIKSLRGNDADAALYWLAAMIAAGEDPKFIARRLIISPSKDVGNADPRALSLAGATGHD